MNSNPMVHTKAAVNYMKPDEAVTGKHLLPVKLLISETTYKYL